MIRSLGSNVPQGHDHSRVARLSVHHHGRWRAARPRAAAVMHGQAPRQHPARQGIPHPSPLQRRWPPAQTPPMQESPPPRHSFAWGRARVIRVAMEQCANAYDLDTVDWAESPCHAATSITFSCAIACASMLSLRGKCLLGHGGVVAGAARMPFMPWQLAQLVRHTQLPCARSRTRVGCVLLCNTCSTRLPSRFNTEGCRTPPHPP